MDRSGAVLGAEQWARLRVGLVSTVLVTAMAVAIWKRPALAGAATFGCVATGMQMLAARMMARTGEVASVDHLKVYVLGVFFRLAGVAVLGVAVMLDRTRFLPLASAIGYLGTVLPLLYLETRLSR